MAAVHNLCVWQLRHLCGGVRTELVLVGSPLECLVPLLLAHLLTTQGYFENHHF